MLASAFGVFGQNIYNWRFLFAAPLIVAALFGASIATLEVRNGLIRFRRFLRWTAITDEDIESAGVVWPPLFGYLSLNRYVFPWGRIYFALDENLNSNPFRRGEYPLLRYLKDPTTAPKHGGTGLGKMSDRPMKFNLLISGLTGALASILLHMVIPDLRDLSVFEQSSAAHQPTIFAYPEKVFRFLSPLPAGLVFFAFFVFLAMFRRRRQDAWLHAFLAGFVLLSISLHILGLD